MKDHVKAYLGLKYSVDGWSWLLGVKIAGLKVKLPFIYLDQTYDYQYNDPNSLKKLFSILGLFVGGSYILKKIDDLLDRKKIQKWQNNNLQNLKEKQEDTLLLIKDKAMRNQQGL